jgi:hypothetical protein
MKQVAPVIALAALLFILMPSAGAQSLPVPFCPLFGNIAPEPSVTSSYSTSGGLSAGEYYLAYTTGSTSSPSMVSEVVTAYTTVQSGTIHGTGQISESELTITSPIPSGTTQINFYIGTSESAMYLASSSTSNSTTISTLPGSAAGAFPMRDAVSCITSSIPITLIGLMLSFLLVGLAFMIGEVLNVSGFKGWYRTELWEVTKSVLMVMSIFAVLAVLSAVAYAFTGNQPISGSSSTLSAYASANLAGVYSADLGSYLGPQLSNANNAFSAIFGLTEGISFAKSFTAEYWIPYLPIPFVGSVQFGGEYTLFKSSYVESDLSLPGSSFVKDVLGVVVIPLIVIFQLLYDKLVEFALLGLTFFVPLGIVLRAIPFLRGIGGTMLAIGISIALVFPALLLMFNLPISNYLPSFAPTPASLACNFATNTNNVGLNIVGGFLDLTLCTNVNIDATVLSVFTGGTYGAYGFVAGWHTVLPTASIFPSLNLILGYVFPLVIQFILLIFDIVITFAVGDAIARMLGGSLKLGIGKFKVA